ncbi:eukaryotic translation initiation factor 4B-like [Anneissia japonica]|uniref:eukaryotic translation initiation factor 4B-like n=1 Tax=Anneissia japonica TaxID=1529436 RepID=UPI00142558D6|nr:eukaryotic translation initiation factor 4B-like [Anneissia japonica]
MITHFRFWGMLGSVPMLAKSNMASSVGTSAPTGKKKGKVKGKTLNLNEFLGGSEGTTAPGNSYVLRSQSWADASEDIDNNGSDYQDDYGKSTVNRAALPTAPRSAQPIEIDKSMLPEKPPYTVFIGNLPYDVDEEDIVNFFRGCNVTQVRLPRDGDGGRLKGFGYAEVGDMESLMAALKLSNENLRNRRIRVDLAGQQQGDGNRESSGEWRRGGGGGYGGRGGEDERAGRSEGSWDRPIVSTDSYDDGPGYRDGYRDRGYGRDRGGYERDRGGYDRDRGYERDQGGYDRDRGGYERDRGAYDRDRGGYDRDRGGYNRDRGGYDGDGYGYRDRGYRDGYGNGDRYNQDRSYDGYGYRDRGYRDGYGNGDRYNQDRSYDGYGSREQGYGRRDQEYGGRDQGYGRDKYGGDRGYGNDRSYGRDRGYGYDRDRRGYDRYDRGGGGGGYGDREGGYDEPHSDEPPKERKKLVLKPRSQPVDGSSSQTSSSSNSTSKSQSSIFGNAKPVDTAARERQIEEKLQREHETEKADLEESRRNRQMNRERPRRDSERSNDEGRTRHSSSSSTGKGPRPVMLRRESERSDDESKKDDTPLSPISPKSPTSPPPRKEDPAKVLVPAPAPKENAWAQRRTGPTSPRSESTSARTNESPSGPKKDSRPTQGKSRDPVRKDERYHSDRRHPHNEPQRKNDKVRKPREIPKYEEKAPPDFAQKNKFAGLAAEDDLFDDD